MSNAAFQFLKSETGYVKNRNIDSIFSSVLEWFKKEKSEIIEIRYPTYVSAVHQYGIDGKPYKKKIDVQLSEMNEGIMVNFIIVNTINYSVKSSSILFVDIFEDFFSYVGVDITDDMLRSIYHKNVLDRVIKSNLFVIMFFGLFSLLFISFFKLHPWLSILSALGVFTPSIFSILSLKKFLSLKRKLYL